MAETIITKRCPQCKQIKALTEFYKNRLSKNGHRCWCKICKSKADQKYCQTKAGKAIKKRYRQSEKGQTTRKQYEQTEKYKTYRKRYSQTEKGRIARIKAIRHYTLAHPERREAHEVVNRTIRNGLLPKATTLKCSCGNQAKLYHHHKGYAKKHQLNVIPVCHKCHQS